MEQRSTGTTVDTTAGLVINLLLLLCILLIMSQLIHGLDTISKIIQHAPKHMILKISPNGLVLNRTLHTCLLQHLRIANA